MKVYITQALPIILNGSEIWTLKRGWKRLTSLEVTFFRRTSESTLLDHKRSEEILEELKLEPVDKKRRRYKSNWLWCVKRMNNRMQIIMLFYRTTEGRRFGRPWKMLLNRPKPSKPNSIRTWWLILISFIQLISRKMYRRGCGRYCGVTSSVYSFNFCDFKDFIYIYRWINRSFSEVNILPQFMKPIPQHLLQYFLKTNFVTVWRIIRDNVSSEICHAHF